MFENMMNFFKKLGKKGNKVSNNSKDAAKERLHLVLMQDRANVSADFLELMKQEIIEVIKKYIDVDEREIDVRLTNKENGDGTNGAPALYANIPIINIKKGTENREVKDKEDIKKASENSKQEETKQENKKEIKDIESKKMDNKDNKENKENSDVEKDTIKNENEDSVQEKTVKEIKESKEEIKSKNK